MTTNDHYFSARPATPDERRLIDVRLAGRDVRVEVAPGIFSPAGVDKGTAVLLEHAPPPPAAGTFLDLGCGWGPLSLTLALTAPHARIYGIDINERSVDLTRRNADSLDLPGVSACHPDQVPHDVSFDLIWSNPPIRIGKSALHEILRRWLPRLAEHANAYLVVQRNLGSDSLARWIQQDLGMPCERVSSHGGFRLLRVCQHRPAPETA